MPWVPPGGNVVRGGTAGAGELTLLSELLVRGLHPGPAGPELFAGWLTCSRFLRVTNSVLRLFRRCCRCTASFDDEASATRVIHKVRLSPTSQKQLIKLQFSLVTIPSFASQLYLSDQNLQYFIYGSFHIRLTVDVADLSEIIFFRFFIHNK